MADAVPAIVGVTPAAGRDRRPNLSDRPARTTPTLVATSSVDAPSEVHFSLISLLGRVAKHRYGIGKTQQTLLIYSETRTIRRSDKNARSRSLREEHGLNLGGNDTIENVLMKM